MTFNHRFQDGLSVRSQPRRKSPVAAKNGVTEPGSGAPRRVFVSYRQSDSAGSTGRLRDALALALGPERVFRESEAIRPGMNFVSALEQALEDCAVLLAVIGPHWLQRLQDYGSQPTDGPVDYLRWELKSALEQGRLLIPILVDGAAMPRVQDLPDELMPLALLQGLELRDKEWEQGLALLLDRLKPELEPAAPATPPVDRRIAVATGLGVVALVVLGVVYSGWPGQPLAGIDTMLPDAVRALAGNRGADGGIALLAVGALLALLRALAGKYGDALAGRFAAWLRDSSVFGVVTAGVVAVPLLLLAGRALFTAVLMTLGVAYLGARVLSPRVFATPMRAGLAGAGALTLLGCALGADIAIDRERQSDFDVAFVLPPEGGADVKVSRGIFDDVSKALRIALKDADRVEVIPTELNDQDFRRYVISNREALLGTQGRKGFPRVFIRVTYSIDAENGVKRIGAKPYFRPAGRAKTIRLLERWDRLPMAGNAASPVVALKAGFELIAFLAHEGLLRLDPAQRQQVWRNLFDEYLNALALHAGDCSVGDDKLTGLRAERATLDEGALRRLLFAPCPEGTRAPLRAADASASAVATAVAPYADLMQP